MNRATQRSTVRSTHRSSERSPERSLDQTSTDQTSQKLLAIRGEIEPLLGAGRRRQIAGNATRTSRNQLGRSNLTDMQRVELALELKPLIAEQARENHLANAGDKTSEAARQNSDAPVISKIRTDEALADLAGVSRDTVRKVEAIRENAAPEVAQAARSGEISINLASQVGALPPEDQTIVAAAPPEQIKEAAREATSGLVEIDAGHDWEEAGQAANKIKEASL